MLTEFTLLKYIEFINSYWVHKLIKVNTQNIFTVIT